jgi:hypothetical protein
MQNLFRSFSTAAVLAADIACGCGAGAANAAEVAYLMYAPGTEGKTVPMRVLWDEVDAGNARITIDLGAQYEPYLAKLGLGRVIKHDAKLNKRQFIVRDLEFTRFVKIVATSIVHGLLQAKAPSEPPAQLPEADVPGAMLLITPTRGPPQLEVIARLHVTYPAPQPSGSPQVKDLLNTDLTFVGKPERTR